MYLSINILEFRTIWLTVYTVRVVWSVYFYTRNAISIAYKFIIAVGVLRINGSTLAVV